MASLAAPAETAELAFGRIVLRPLRPGDRAAYWRFAAALSREDIRQRFGGAVRADARLLERLLNFDPAAEEAFAAFAADGAMLGAMLGVARIVFAAAEIAVIVRSDMKHRGIGEALLFRLVRFCRERGIDVLHGFVLDENLPALTLARKHGCTLEREASTVEISYRVE
jgi:acetyltransferase